MDEFIGEKAWTEFRKNFKMGDFGEREKVCGGHDQLRTGVEKQLDLYSFSHS